MTTPSTHQKAMETAATPPFVDELAEVWGERWGAWDEAGRLRRVLVRRPGDELSVIDADAWSEEAEALVDPDGKWYWTDRQPPDIARVNDQHAGLTAALQREGVAVEIAPSLGAPYTKSMYTRDPIITTPHGAIIGRMGVRMRRGEEPDLSRFVAGLGMPIVGTITGTGTLEGGSYCKLRPDLHLLGTSIRCNEEGARQLRELLALMDVELLVVPISGWSIHLDLHLAVIDAERVLVDVEHLPYDFLLTLGDLGFELVEVDRGEAWGINLLCLSPGRVLMAEGSPRTAERLFAAGVEVIPIPYDEIQKNGGGIHCSTMELVRERAT